MPVGIFEHHPFLDYYIKCNPRGLGVSKYDSLIIGSFPVHALTSPAPNAAPRPGWQQQARFGFFYGSGTASDHNLFWDCFLSAYGQEGLLNPIRPGVELSIIGVLERNGYLITDVLSITDREDESPLDSSLLKTAAGCQFNLRVLDFLFDCPNLRYLYFTALPNAGNSPWGWFKKILLVSGARLSMVEVNPLVKKLTVVYKGKSRELLAFFLFSPASYRGVHMARDRRHPAFLKYLSKNYQALMPMIPPLGNEMPAMLKRQLKVVRPIFLSELYHEFFVQKNILFP